MSAPQLELRPEKGIWRIADGEGVHRACMREVPSDPAVACAAPRQKAGSLVCETDAQGPCTEFQCLIRNAATLQSSLQATVTAGQLDNRTWSICNGGR